MEITEIRVYPLSKEDSTLKAFASVTFDDAIVVTGIRVIDGSNGLFISMPQSKDNDGEYHDIVFPKSKEARTELQDAVIDAFMAEAKPKKKSYGKK